MLDIALSMQIDKLCDRFEATLRRGGAPPWNEVLAEVPDGARWTLLRELIVLDLSLTPARKEADTYAQQFPEHAPAIRELFTPSAVTAPTIPPTDASLEYAERGLDGWTGLSPAAGAQQTFSIGTVLAGRYRLDQILGEGGMGRVFRAWDIRLERQVAVKALLCRSTAKRDQWERRFLEEVRLAAALEHPSIAAVYDYGIHRGQPFAVFAYLPGPTLGELLARQGPLSVEDVRLIAGPLAQALDEAHIRGVVHRDLKPANIKGLTSGQFAILDFGLARRLDRDHAGGFSGTPAYTAPEQARGQPTDGRADQYALALIVYELLCGRRPFAATAPEDYLRLHAEELAPNIRTFAPSVPVVVASALAIALAKDPAGRFDTCVAFATALGCQLMTDTTEAPGLFRLAAVRFPTRVYRLEITTSRGAIGLSSDFVHLERNGLVESLPHTSLESVHRSERDVVLQYALPDKNDGMRRIRFAERADAEDWKQSLARHIPNVTVIASPQLKPVVLLHSPPSFRCLLIRR